MLSLSIGPLALPVAPLLVLAALGLGGWVATRVAGAGGPRAAGDTLWQAAFLALGVSRLVFVAVHFEAYRASPWAIVDLRDGGLHAPAGLGAAAAWIAWRMRTQPSLRRGLGAGVLAAAVVWSVASWALGRWDRPDLPEVAVTDHATGRATTLRQALDGRPGVINLWASWCAPCRQEMPALEAVLRDTRDVAVLRVNQGEAPAVVAAYLQRDGLTAGGVLLDGSRALGSAVGSAALPTTLFIDRDGRRVDAHVGILTEPALRARIAALRAAR
jgi:thiol-disulfide isomerase/thioredoxin